MRESVRASCFRLSRSYLKPRLPAHSPAAGRTSSSSPSKDTAAKVLNACCSVVRGVTAAVRDVAVCRLATFPFSRLGDNYHRGNITETSSLCLRGASLSRKRAQRARIMVQFELRAGADHITLHRAVCVGTRGGNVACGGGGEESLCLQRLTLFGCRARSPNEKIDFCNITVIVKLHQPGSSRFCIFFFTRILHH